MQWMRWRRTIGTAALTLLVATAAGVGRAESNCITACVDKVDLCGERCEELSESTSWRPATFDQCQVGCAEALFVSCFTRCLDTNVVVEDDYVLVDEDRVGVMPPPPAAPADR